MVSHTPRLHDQRSAGCRYHRTVSEHPRDAVYGLDELAACRTLEIEAKIGPRPDGFAADYPKVRQAARQLLLIPQVFMVQSDSLNHTLWKYPNPPGARFPIYGAGCGYGYRWCDQTYP